MGEDVNNYEEIYFDEDDFDEEDEDGCELQRPIETGYESSSSDEFLELPFNDVSITDRK